MSHYIMIRRLRGPAILLLIGGVWLLHASGLINHPWHWFWPLLLIMIGVFMLVERAALAAGGGLSARSIFWPALSGPALPWLLSRRRSSVSTSPWLDHRFS